MVAIRVMQERTAHHRMLADGKGAGRRLLAPLAREAEDQLNVLRPFLQPLDGEPSAAAKPASPSNKAAIFNIR
jgi:hypothetical protein